jgi:hypothetical protein
MTGENSLDATAIEIRRLCLAPAESAFEYAAKIGKELLSLCNRMPQEKVIAWCSASTPLDEWTAKNYMQLAEQKIPSPFCSKLAVLGQAYRLLTSVEDRESLDKIEEGRRAYLRKRQKIASAWLTQMIRADSGKFASTVKFMESWFKPIDPNVDKEQDILFIIIENYLAHLENPNRRLQAIHTLISRLRAKGTDYQVEVALEQ